MTPRDIFRDLYRHMEWADANVWRTVLASDTARADEELRRRLHHVHVVQRAFLSVWRGEPVDRFAGETLDTPAMASWARSYYPEAHVHLSAATDEALEAIVDLPWARYVADNLGHEPGPATLAETILQACSHTTHHRGQILTALGALGVTSGNNDYIMWLWQGRPDPRWP